jgi:acyl-CoA synthetase (AMP-forming)/AMP-acid ligase II
VESTQAFRDGWFYPGDIGRLTQEKLLVIAGREKTIVNIGGDKLNPELVEEVILSFAGVAQAGVFGVANEMGIEELWSLIVPRADFDERALRAHCAGNLLETFVPVRFIAVDSLPLNDMGKLERPRLPEIAKVKLN